MSPEPFEIDPADLQLRLGSDDPPVILDVREPWEIEIASLAGIMAGIMTIPLGELPRRVGELPRDRPLAIMCHHGGRSAQATGWLRQQGFARAMNVAGGIDGWARLIDPGVPRY
jgi:rhodanese-related sulfurtransferase